MNLIHGSTKSGSMGSRMFACSAYLIKMVVILFLMFYTSWSSLITDFIFWALIFKMSVAKSLSWSRFSRFAAKTSRSKR